MSKDDAKITEQQDLVDKLASFKDAILQNRLARYSMALFLLFIAILLFLPVLIDNNALKGSSVKKLKEVLGHDIIVKGDVNVEILPTPKIIARDVLIIGYTPEGSKYSYNLFAKGVEVKLKFFYSSKTSIIKEIGFSGLVAEKRYLSKNNTDIEGVDIRNIKLVLKNRYGTSNKINKTSSGINLDFLSLNGVGKSDFSLKKFPRIKLSDAKIITYDVYENKREYNSLNCVVDISNNRIKSDGYFVVEDILTSFETKLVFDKKLKNNLNSYLQIKSPSLNFRFDGNLSSASGVGDDFAINGSLISEIKDLRDFYLSYVGAKSAFSKKLKNNTPLIKVTAKISSDKDGSFLDDVKIKSPIVNGEGSISIYKSSPIPIIDVLLNVKDIDIDAMWSSSPVKLENEEEDGFNPIFGIDKVETISSAQDQEILKKDYDLTLEIKSDLTIYKNTSLRGLNIYLTSQTYGQLVFNPISFEFPGNGKFHANGELNSSVGVPKFVGKINVSGDRPEKMFASQSITNERLKLDFISKYNLYSDIVLLPSKMDLNNLFVNLNQDETELSGNLEFSIIDKKPSFKGTIRVNHVNIQDQISHFNIAKYVNKGSLIEKLFWLNDLSYETILKLKLDKISYETEEFLNNSMDVQIRRGNISLTNVVIDPDFRNSKANFIIDIGKSTPELLINLSAKDLSLFSKDPKDDKVQYISQKEGAKVQEDLTFDTNLLFRQDTFDQFFNLVSLNGFSGEMKFGVEKMMFKNKPLTNFSFDSKLNNGVLDNVLIRTKIGDADFDYKGIIGLKKVKTLSGIALLRNAKVQPLAADLLGIKDLDAALNISMSLSSFGDSREAFAQNLDGELKFNSIAPEVKGYGLNDLIRKMFFPKKNYEELKTPDKLVENKDSITRFKSASGSVTFKKGVANLQSKVKGLLSNSVLVGDVGLLDKEVNLAFNTVFMTGTKKKLTPISIATNISGNVGNISYASNYDQVMQYLGLKPTVKKLETEESRLEEEKKENKNVDKKTLEQIEQDRLNKVNSVLRKQGVYVPKNNEDQKK